MMRLPALRVISSSQSFCELTQIVVQGSNNQRKDKVSHYLDNGYGGVCTPSPERPAIEQFDLTNVR